MSWNDLEKRLSFGPGSGSSVWEEDPVDFRIFVESLDYCSFEGGLTEVQYSDIEAIIGTDPKKLFSPERVVIVGALLYGKGSGKGIMSSFVGAYVVYVLLCLKDPQAFFQSVPGEHLDIIFVARKKAQVTEIAFAKFKNRLYLKGHSGIQSCKWFFDNYKIVEEGRVRNSPKDNKGTIKISKGAVEFPKKIFAYAESSNNESFEGYNIIFWILDEISAFISDAEKTNGRAILDTLRTSAISRTTMFVKGFGMCLSFPRREDDIMFDLLKESKERPGIFAALRFPWDVKPARYFSDETFRFEHERVQAFLGVEYVDIPVMPYAEDFQSSNPHTVAEAMMKFLCVPLTAEAPYFQYEEKLNILIDVNREPLFTADSFRVVDPVASDKFLVKNRIVKWNYDGGGKPYYDYPRVIHVDVAKNQCRAALGVGHWEYIKVQTPGGVVEKEAKIIDCVIYWTPDKSTNTIVSIVNISELVQEIASKIKLAVLSYDRWNSLESIERFRNRGIEAVEIGSASSYPFLREDVYDSNIFFSMSPGCLEAQKELKYIETDVTGEKVKKGSYFSDGADAVASISRVLDVYKSNLMRFNKSMGRSVGSMVSTFKQSDNQGVPGFPSSFDNAFSKVVGSSGDSGKPSDGASRSMGRTFKRKG